MFWQLLKLVTHCTGQKVYYGKKEYYYSKSELLSLFSKGSIGTRFVHETMCLFKNI